MVKKILAIVLIITVSLFICTSVFAEEKNMIDNAKNVVNDVMGNAQNVVTDATNGIKNVTGNAENTMNDTTNNITNDMNTNNAENNSIIDNGIMDGDITGGADGAYSAARTTATDTVTTNSYVWIILAIAAIVVIGAIWYYAVRSTNDNHYDE